ncbi:MAG TPA: ATP-binding protein [Thermomicrobiaceae bacterium]|nr:ATP-binding protein [Thermomicrobiaceae bacterium]
MSALPETATVPLALIVEAQRRLLGAESLPELAEATWSLARGVAASPAVRLYQRTGDDLVPVQAHPEAAVESETPVERGTGLVIACAPPADAPAGAVVLEHGGGDAAALQALAELAAQALCLRLRHQEERERERRSFARYLHDGIVQDLAYLALQLDLLTRGLPLDAGEARRLATRLRGEVDTAIGGLRGTIGELRRARTPVRTGRTDAPVPDLERAVLAIVREALQNVRKHARASRVVIELVGEQHELRLSVSDNGIGFARREDAIAGEHFGLEQMRELAGELGGELALEPAPGGGTRLAVHLPLHGSEWVW